MLSMLIPKEIIEKGVRRMMEKRGITSTPRICKLCIGARRRWRNRTPEEKKAYSEMRSRVQKETIKNNPHLKKIRAESMRKVTQKYWDTIEESKKQEHIRKMSKGMKEAWDGCNEDFGPLVAHKENIKKLNGNIVIEKDIPRINDYAGVVTESQLAEL